MAFKNLADIKSQLEDRYQGVVTVPMWKIRDAYGADRLGVNVTANIMEALDGMGIGHLPPKLEQDQWANARLFLKNSPVGRFVQSVTKIDADEDQTLRRLSNEKADEVLRRVRELVCE